ncbi:MAG TPA: hypothetical protein VN668_14275 [Stellaceae bacterium]|nr:hypothetical protein [Stellaceae bacterium]
MSSLNDPRRWRLRAEELRTIADNCSTPEARAPLLRLAKDYELLAERAEARAAASRDRETPTG